MDDIWPLILTYCNNGTAYKSVTMVNKKWHGIIKNIYPHAQFRFCNLAATLAKCYDDIILSNANIIITTTTFIQNKGYSYDDFMKIESRNWAEIARDPEIQWIISINNIITGSYISTTLLYPKR